MFFFLTGISFYGLKSCSAQRGIFFRLGRHFFCVGTEEFFPAHAKMKVGACLFSHEDRQHFRNCELSAVFILQNLAA